MDGARLHLQAHRSSRRRRLALSLWIAGSALLGFSRAEATVVRWTPIVGGPSPRDFAAVAYGDGNIFVFGGRNVSTPLNDAWLWKAGAWKPITTGNPSARFGAAMAYDPNLKVFVLTGGTVATAPLAAATYYFNPLAESWSGPFDTAGPQRAFHALAFDPIDNHVMLFGGTAGGAVFPTDLLSWDGLKWRIVTTTGGGTLDRMRHGLVYDAVQGGLVLYGGNIGGFVMDDAWVLKAGAWTMLSNAWTGMGRHGEGFFYDPNQGKITIFAGRLSSGVTSESFLANGATTERVYPVGTSAPTARSGVAMVYDEARRIGVAIGGSNSASTPQPDANWEFFMTGQKCLSNAECATDVCATGVCCLTACDPPCKDCDRLNTMLDPPAIDGQCRLVTGMDPRFCVFDPGCRGTCSEVATCVFPGPTKACGKCLACNDQNGKCELMPTSEDDPTCMPPPGTPAPSCSQADLSCRTYGAPTTFHRCLAPGKCGWRWSDCTNFSGSTFPCP